MYQNLKVLCIWMKNLMAWIINVHGDDSMICAFACLLDVLCKYYYVVGIRTLSIWLSILKGWWKYYENIINFFNFARARYNHNVEHGNDIYNIFLVTFVAHFILKLQYTTFNVLICTIISTIAYVHCHQVLQDSLSCNLHHRHIYGNLVF